ncbi:hypothetical protein [Fibrobacter sp.]|uniref:hypothetical protein n=1 Tax=Fibrobacter sp. TaxID=35828 RepID=UPI00386CEAE2
MDNFVHVDWEKFRHDLAFPIGGERVNAADTDAAYQYLVGLCSILPRFYGDELDRANLWGRIDSALSVAASRCSRSDEIPDCLLSHICADAVRAAADKDLKAFFDSARDLNLAAAKQIIATRRLLVICNARANWMEYKEQ